MIKTLNPYTNPAKTAEIMSRYRPIAPKPETSSNTMSEGSSSLSQKIKQSPYLRNLWPQLQARPTRTRKRGRAPLTLPSSSLKRQKTHVLGFCPPCHVTSPAKNLSLQSFAPPPPTLPPPLPLTPNHGHGVLNCSMENTPTNPSLVTLPLLPCSPSANSIPTEPKLDSALTTKPCGGEALDLNTKVSVPEERDLLQQLQKPVSNNVIAPQPVRPIGSSISVVCISEDSTLPPVAQTPKRPHEVEEQLESEALPVVISDSNHRVRMANSAYKEMVGQPVCPWLESMVKGGDGNLQCKRISGEVTLHLCDSNIPTSTNGFSCWVRIEWQSQHKKSCVNAFCDVIKLACASRDYLFTWRFHTRTREASQSSCNA
ncbi:Transducin family protein / WD-40 repeat family protein [Spatholobus suberectus]|nr:Transducin family protein / WD-40 repeat family protein [Spatholobus suberectus]